MANKFSAHDYRCEYRYNHYTEKNIDTQLEKRHEYNIKYEAIDFENEKNYYIKDKMFISNTYKSIDFFFYETASHKPIKRIFDNCTFIDCSFDNMCIKNVIYINCKFIFNTVNKVSLYNIRFIQCTFIKNGFVDEIIADYNTHFLFNQFDYDSFFTFKEALSIYHHHSFRFFPVNHAKEFIGLNTKFKRPRIKQNLYRDWSSFTLSSSDKRILRWNKFLIFLIKLKLKFTQVIWNP